MKMSCNMKRRMQRNKLKKINTLKAKVSTQREFLKSLRCEIKNSSAHGLPHIVDGDIHWFERIFWSASFTLSLIIIYILVSSQFTRFINSPTVMSIEMDYLEWNTSFPALTMCPAIKVNLDDFNDLVTNLYNSTGMYLEQYVWAIATAHTLSLKTVALIDPNNTNPISPDDYAKTAARLFNKFDKKMLKPNLNYSMSLHSAMTEMGMCHVINSNVAIFDDPLVSDTPDLKYIKSNVELSVFDSDFYAEILNNDAISTIYIHSPNEPILSTFPSYTVETEGFMTYKFQIWSTKISNELRNTPLKVRKCRFIDEPISSRYPVYSYNHCLIECKIQLILKLCGCVPHFYKTTGTERICKLSELKCFLEYKREIMSLSVSDDIFKKFKSTKSMPRTPKDCSCLSNCETDIYRKDSEDYVPETATSRLRIAFSAFPKTRIVRDIIFSFSDIFLKSGGVVNTCIGTSVISIMELAVAFIRLITNFLFERSIDIVKYKRFMTDAKF